jgi:hypothetical protein
VAWLGSEAVGLQTNADHIADRRIAERLKPPGQHYFGGKLMATVSIIARAAVTVGAIVAVGLVALPSSSAAAGRTPVMGCFNFSIAGPNLYAADYAPQGRCYFATGIIGIDHVRWSHWGRPRATGSGYLIDGLGFEHKATMMISGLSQPCPVRPGPKVYSKLRVTWHSFRAVGVLRPTGEHVFNVVPSDIDC